MSSLAPPRAILFDFDGVLATSHTQHTTAWHTAYAELRGEPLDGEALAALSGLSPMAIAAALVHTSEEHEEATRLYDRKLETMMQAVEHVTLLDGTRELLAHLARVSIPYGIASNSPRVLVRAVLAHHGIEVEHVLGHDDYTEPKPAPEAYLKLGRRLGFKTLEEVWVVEDSAPGLDAARRSGAGVIVGVRSPKHDESSFRHYGAHLVVHNPGELIAHI